MVSPSQENRELVVARICRTENQSEVRVVASGKCQRALGSCRELYTSFQMSGNQCIGKHPRKAAVVILPVAHKVLGIVREVKPYNSEDTR